MFKKEAKQANRLHQEAKEHAKQALVKAMQTGKVLYAVRHDCKYGEWEPWVEENLDFEITWVRVYIRIYKHWDALKQNADAVTTITNARNFLASLDRPQRPSVTTKVENDGDTDFIHAKKSTEIISKHVAKAIIECIDSAQMYEFYEDLIGNLQGVRCEHHSVEPGDSDSGHRELVFRVYVDRGDQVDTEEENLEEAA